MQKLLRRDLCLSVTTDGAELGCLVGPVDAPVGRWPAAGCPGVLPARRRWACPWADPASSPTWFGICGGNDVTVRRPRGGGGKRLCVPRGRPHSHLSGGVLRGSHPGALLQPPAEQLVDADARIRRRTCGKPKQRCGGCVWLHGALRGDRGGGGLPREKISQRRTPKDHTSLWVVYTRSKMVSGAIHFRGRRACSKKEDVNRVF